jgi:hypothetical protein
MGAGDPPRKEAHEGSVDPDYYWKLITACWSHVPRHRPTFQTSLDDFVCDHKYAFTGTDMDELFAYERKVYGKFDRRRDQWSMNNGEIDMFTARIKAIVDSPLDLFVRSTGHLQGRVLAPPARLTGYHVNNPNIPLFKTHCTFRSVLGSGFRFPGKYIGCSTLR